MTQVLTKVRFGHSPDPDDAFMFYAIRHQKIDLNGFEIEHVVEDIESLNQRALNGELEATAVSVHAYAYLADQYAIMRSGASVGEKYGPIVVTKDDFPSKSGMVLADKKEFSEPSLYGKTIAVPGRMTTAYLALRLFESEFHSIAVAFDQIMDCVKSGKVDAGLLIHEGQITFQDHGLKKVLDLGEWWWGETGLPLPLGIDVVHKGLGGARMKQLADIFKASILYALEHRDEALDYALLFGRGLGRQATDRFVSMYVNHETCNLSPQGEEGIRELLRRAHERKIVPRKVIPEFI